MFRGIHADAKNQWLDIIDSNIDRLVTLPNTLDRLRLLQNYARNINGIGEVAVWDTLLYIEQNQY